MSYPRFSDIDGEYICGCGKKVSREKYLDCQDWEVHKTKICKERFDDSLFTLVNELKKTDSNIKKGIFGMKRGRMFVVHDREKFIRDYSGRDWFNQVSVYQEPPTIFDFSFKEATNEEIENAIYAYPSGSCKEIIPCGHKVIIKIKEFGDPYDIYRIVPGTMNAVNIYNKFQLKDKLDLKKWGSHFSKQA